MEKDEKKSGDIKDIDEKSGGETGTEETAEEQPEKEDHKEGTQENGDSDKKIKKWIKEKKDKKDEKIEELTDRVTRQMAEFDNFRKRTEKEKSLMYEVGVKSVVEKILPVVDSFERGIEAARGNEEDPFAQGMEKVYRQLMTALENLGVTPIDAVGKPFDPELHNAVMHIEDEELGDNIVAEELQKGYKYRDSVVRHSMVKVAN